MKEKRHYYNRLVKRIYYIQYLDLVTHNPVGWTYRYAKHPLFDYWGWVTHGSAMFDGHKNIEKGINAGGFKLIPKKMEYGITCFDHAISPDVFETTLYKQQRLARGRGK